MTTYDYYSIPFRIGILVMLLSCLAIGNLVMYLQDAMSSSAFKCLIALWALLGLVAVDIAKNAIRRQRYEKNRRSYKDAIPDEAARFGFGG